MSRKPPDFSIGSKVWPGVLKLVEECGELTQVLSKLMVVAGSAEHWDGTDLHARVAEELADVLAAAQFVLQNCPELDAAAVRGREVAKMKLFRQWHDGEVG